MNFEIDCADPYIHYHFICFVFLVMLCVLLGVPVDWWKLEFVLNRLAEQASVGSPPELMDLMRVKVCRLANEFIVLPLISKAAGLLRF